jgi:nucleoside-diphosphate-sugar epimerase
MIGAAVIRRLLADPAYEVRVSDRRPAPQWMREGCEVHVGDLREPDQARSAAAGCAQIVHLAGVGGGVGDQQKLPHTLAQANVALCDAVLGAALGEQVERFVYVSCAAAFEGAEVFPTLEEHLADCPAPSSAYGLSKLMGEVCCRAAHEEHGLPYTICRAAGAYGPGELPGAEPGTAHAVPDLIAKVLGGRRPLQIFGSGEQTRTLTHVDDLAEGIVTAIGAPAAVGEDFNICAARETAVAELAALIWEACGEDPAELELEHLPAFPLDVQRRWPSAEKARRVLGWEARVDLAQGIAATVAWVRGLRVSADQ